MKMINAQVRIVICHPNSSAIFAILYMDSAPPIWAKKFKMPEMLETFPYLLNCTGIYERIIRFTPCIQPVIMLESAIESHGLDE